MPIDSDTLASIPRSDVSDKDAIYPDRAATRNSDGTYSIRDTGTTKRLSDEVPRTSVDMNKLFLWIHGEEVYGTHAEEHVGMKNYRRDINKAYGKQDSYQDFYIDTTKPLSKQLKDQSK